MIAATASPCSSPISRTTLACGFNSRFSPGASKRNEMLCWVCRRLKISAWKDVEKISLPE